MRKKKFITSVLTVLCGVVVAFAFTLTPSSAASKAFGPVQVKDSNGSVLKMNYNRFGDITAVSYKGYNVKYLTKYSYKYKNKKGVKKYMLSSTTYVDDDGKFQYKKSIHFTGSGNLYHRQFAAGGKKLFGSKTMIEENSKGHITRLKDSAKRISVAVSYSYYSGKKIKVMKVVEKLAGEKATTDYLTFNRYGVLVKVNGTKISFKQDKKKNVTKIVYPGGYTQTLKYKKSVKIPKAKRNAVLNGIILTDPDGYYDDEALLNGTFVQDIVQDGALCSIDVY